MCRCNTNHLSIALFIGSIYLFSCNTNADEYALLVKTVDVVIEKLSFL